MRRAPTIAIAITVSIVVVLSGCSGSKSNEADPTSTRSAASKDTTTSTPTDPPATTSAAEAVDKAAQAAVIKFWAMHDVLASNPSSKLERLATVSRGQALAQMRTTLFRQRLKGWRQVGSATVVDTSSQPRGGHRYDVTACLDVSKVNVVNRKGQSVIVANRPPRTQVSYVVDDTPDGWFVVRDKFQVTTC